MHVAVGRLVLVHVHFHIRLLPSCGSAAPKPFLLKHEAANNVLLGFAARDDRAQPTR